LLKIWRNRFWKKTNNYLQQNIEFYTHERYVCGYFYKI
jgi:hypothetical protein